MDLSLSCCSVPRTALDLSEHRYWIAFFPQEVKPNPVHLPLLLQEGEVYRFLSGSLLETQDDVAALVLPAVSPPLHIFRCILQHRLLFPGLSSIDQALFFHRAGEVLAPEDLLSFLPELGLKAEPHVLQELRSLLSLHPAAQVSLHEGQLSLNAAKKLGQIPKHEQEIVVNVVEKLHLGGSKQQKLLELLFTLMKRRQLGVAELLRPWQEHEWRQEDNIPQQAARLLLYLEQCCQPRLHRAEEQFRTVCKQLKLPPGVKLSHSPAFEEDWVRLHIDFPNMEALTVLWPRLRQHVKQD